MILCLGQKHMFADLGSIPNGPGLVGTDEEGTGNSFNFWIQRSTMLECDIKSLDRVLWKLVSCKLAPAHMLSTLAMIIVMLFMFAS